jgi:hypothetical protein
MSTLLATLALSQLVFPGVAPEPNALSLREGAVPVTAYVDVHCNPCAQAMDWIIRRNGLPRAALGVVFISGDASSRLRAELVLCAPPHLRSVALQQAFASHPEAEWLRCAAGHRQALIQERVADARSLEGTPVFVVSGQTVLGFDRARLEVLVNRSGK